MVAFWASWCVPCLEELKNLEAARARLEAEGLRVVLLSVDEPERRTDARALLDRLGVHFEQGVASREILDIFETMQRVHLDRRRPIGLPSSFLLDRAGRLAAIYRGPADPGAILDDLGALPLSGSALRDRAVPFPGIWLSKAPLPPLDQLAQDFLFYDLPKLAGFFISGEREKITAEYGGLVDTDYELRGNVYRMNGDLRVEQGDTKGARELYRAAVRAYERALRSGESPEAANNLGVVYSKLGENEEAVMAYLRAVDSHPEPGTVHRNLDKAYAVIGQKDDAARHLELAIPYVAENLELRMELARRWVQLERLDDAERVLKEAIAAYPKEREPRHRLGEFFLYRKDMVRARDVFQETLELFPTDPAAHIGIARVHTVRREYEQARKHYHQAIESAPRSFEALSEVGVVYLQLKQNDKALEYLSRALEVYPEETRTIFLVARLQMLAGNRSEAMALHARLEKLDAELAGKLKKFLDRAPKE